MNAEEPNRPEARERRGRTIVLGLDSIDLQLLERWIAQGLLPFFSSLLRDTPLVRLTTLSRVLQSAVWPSILTGQSPGHHGHYSYTQLKTGTYNLDKEWADSVAGERFYKLLAPHGIRSAVVDIPMDLPDPKCLELQVVDWGTEFKYWGFTTHPPQLREEIETRFGNHVLQDYGITGDSLAEHRKLSDDLRAAVRLKSAFTRQLLERTDLDFIFVVFGEAHKAGHFLWKYMDARHPDHLPAAPTLGDALLAQYQTIDRELADLAARLSPEDNLVVFSDHGMQANYRGEHLMGALLERLGLCPAASDARLDGEGIRASAADRAGRTLRLLAHQVVRRIAPAGFTRKLRERFGAGTRVDWSRTRAFIVPTDRNSYLRINLRDREPQGIVAPGPEYEELLQYIEKEFRALINPETGRAAVEEIFRVQALYPGPRAADLPDLAILWSSESPINALESAKIGRLEKRAIEQRSGNHRPEGFLVGRGPAFKTGRAEVRGDILQIAPTLLALHRVPIPSTFEMGPLDELFV